MQCFFGDITISGIASRWYGYCWVFAPLLRVHDARGDVQACAHVAAGRPDAVNNIMRIMGSVKDWSAAHQHELKMRRQSELKLEGDSQ